MMDSLHTLVIGAGAAGMAAAVAAASCGDVVTVLERGAKTLKKLGVTGNGRGNLLNSGPPRYPGGAAFAAEVFTRMPYGRLADFWQKELGVPLRQEEDGRMYPASLQAAVAVDALRLRAHRLGIHIQCNTRVTGLRAEGGGFTAEAEETVPAPENSPKTSSKTSKKQASPPLLRTFHAKRVIVAVGGAAAPAHGTDGTGYALLQPFGHVLLTPRPALCALQTQGKPLQGLAGQRVRAKLSLCSPKGELLAQSEGEALFAADGVSGIAAMQLARYVYPGCVLHMDMRDQVGFADLSEVELSARLEARVAGWQSLAARELWTGLVAWPLGRALLTAARIQPDRPIAEIGKEGFRASARALMDYSLAVTGTRGFQGAQVTAGGIETVYFSPATLESTLQRGLYAAGEVLDVDGDCGGFNLMFAFASGLLAGRMGR